MSLTLIRRAILGRRFCTAVARRAEDIMPNPDCRPSDLFIRVWYLLSSVEDVDTAAKYARLAVFSKTKGEDTESTCENIIAGMVHNKRYKDANDLYDYFFNQHKLKPTRRCCNYILESRFQQGLVEEALEFHQFLKSSGMPRDYPSEDTFRVLSKGLVYSGRLDQAEALLRDKKPFVHLPDHVAFNNLIRGFLDLGEVDKANLVLNEFKQVWSRVVVSEDYQMYPRYENRAAFLMASFMEYWFKQGKETEAMECYNQSVLANKFLICAETGNVLLKILLKYGMKSHAWDLYHEMLHQSNTSEFCYIHMNHHTIEMMVNECFDMGQCNEAIDTYNKASANKNFLRKGYIIARCCENGLLTEAESLFADSVGYIDVHSFKIMIDAYVKAGRIDDALKTSNKMIDASLKEVSDLI